MKKEYSDFSPNEKKLAEFMQQALKDNPDLFPIESNKPVDYSFMNSPPHKRKHFFSYRAMRVAVIVVCLFSIAFGFAVWINSEPASAVKFSIEKKINEIKSSFFSTDDEAVINYTDDNQISYKFKSMEEVNKAVDIMPSLYIPEYIPEGYDLEELRIDKNINNSYSAEYRFINTDENSFFIGIQEIKEGDLEYTTFAEGELIEYGGRMLCYWTDKSTQTSGVNFIEDGSSVYIMGTLSQDEMTEIAINLKQRL